MNNNSLFKVRGGWMLPAFYTMLLLLCVTIVSAQNVPIRGTITDAQGLLPSVNVQIKNKAIATVTDANGNFEIQALPEDTLIVSSMGYLTLELSVGSQTTFNLTLVEDATALEEVTVNAGYYKVKDTERTGSIASIKAADIEKQPVMNVLATMQGRMAGVDITQDSGIPGGGFNIQIRGLNSLRRNGNSPLYIIDGVPFASDAIGNAQTSTILPNATSPLNSINPSDIESIEVLKDADATAIYGSRGANGVVLLTTKKGKAGKTQFSVNASTAFGNVTKNLDLLNTAQYLAVRRAAFENDNISEFAPTDYDVNGTWSETRYTDWQKELLGGTSKINSLQASVSGGSDQTHFLLSGNAYKQGTVFPGKFDYKKGGGHASFNHESTDKKFMVAFSGSYSVERNNQPSADLTRIARNLAPNAPALYDAEGNLNWENSTWENPLAALNSQSLTQTHGLIVNTTLSYELPLNFIARANVGITDMQNRETKTDPSTIYDPVYEASAEYSSLFLNSTSRSSWIVEPQLNWEKIYSNHKLNILVGSTFQRQLNDELLQFGSGFTSNSLLYDLSSASYIKTFSDAETEYRYQAIFGRVNYSYKNKYFLNLTGRRDGSSRFGPGKQFANFGAIGAAWIFSEEKIIKNSLPFLSFGKLRASYGITGNDQIGDYQYLDTYTSSGNDYDGTIGLSPIRLFNPNFSWETNNKFEASVELGFLKDRITTSISYYRNRSSNQLVGIPLPGTTGFSFIQANLDATVQNSGLELTLRTGNFIRKNFEWISSINFTQAKNKLITFPGLEGSTYQSQYVLGESISIQKLYHYIGINEDTGVYEFEDVNGDGEISYTDDAKTLRDFSPKFYGGFSNSFRYKQVHLDFLFQFVKQINWNARSQYEVPGTFGNQATDVLGSWQPSVGGGSNQIYTTGVNGDAANAYTLYAGSDAAVADASYIRLKNVALSYDVPLPLKSVQCKLFVQGQNLLTFTSFKDGDPEFQNRTLLPPLRILSFGAELKF